MVQLEEALAEVHLVRASPWRTNECPSVIIVIDPRAALLLLHVVLLHRVRLHQDHHVRRHFHQLFHTICVAARAARRGRDGNEILGTAIIGSGTVESTGFSTATNWSTICGSETLRAGTTGATSPNCSAVCRRTRSCGRGSAKTPGRTPASQAALDFCLRRGFVRSLPGPVRPLCP